MLPTEKSQAGRSACTSPVPSFSFRCRLTGNTRSKSNIGVIGEETIFGSSAQYASLFVRCSQASPACKTQSARARILGGRSTRIHHQYQPEPGSTETSGFDFQGQLAGPLRSTGVQHRLAEHVREDYDFQIVEAVHTSIQWAITARSSKAGDSLPAGHTWAGSGSLVCDPLKRYQSGYEDQTMLRLMSLTGSGLFVTDISVTWKA